MLTSPILVRFRGLCLCRFCVTSPACVIVHVTRRHYIGWNNNEPGWMHLYCPTQCMIDMPLNTRYLASIYYVMTTMTTVGYGDILPKNNAGGGLPWCLFPLAVWCWSL